MSEHPHEQPTVDPDRDAGTASDRPDEPASERPLDDVPPVAGGTDDSPPAQGEGEHDSW